MPIPATAVQNRSGNYWTEDEVNNRLKPKMIEETERIWEMAAEKSIPMRTAAYVVALKRIEEAVRARGTQDYFTDGP